MSGKPENGRGGKPEKGGSGKPERGGSGRSAKGGSGSRRAHSSHKNNRTTSPSEALSFRQPGQEHEESIGVPLPATGGMGTPDKGRSGTPGNNLPGQPPAGSPTSPNGSSTGRRTRSSHKDNRTSSTSGPLSFRQQRQEHQESIRCPLPEAGGSGTPDKVRSRTSGNKPPGQPPAGSPTSPNGSSTGSRARSSHENNRNSKATGAVTFQKSRLEHQESKVGAHTDPQKRT